MDIFPGSALKSPAGDRARQEKGQVTVLCAFVYVHTHSYHTWIKNTASLSLLWWKQEWNVSRRSEGHGLDWPRTWNRGWCWRWLGTTGKKMSKGDGLALGCWHVWETRTSTDPPDPIRSNVNVEIVLVVGINIPDEHNTHILSALCSYFITSFIFWTVPS